MEELLDHKPKKSVWRFPLFFVLIIWSIYWVEIQFGYNFNKFGIYPRTVKGLRGILCSPFIHSSTSHLFNNSVPLFVLTACLLFFYKSISIKVASYGLIFTGILTWLIARESYHIGASGVVYMLFSFIFFSGVIRRHYRLIATSLVTIFLYGSMVWYMFPTEDRISWEGHLSGFIIGLLLAIFYRKKGLVKENYVFSKTEFDDYFDENGNFIIENKDVKD